VRPPRDAARCGDSHGTHPRQELKEKPIPQDDERRDGNEENEHEREYASSRIKNDIGSHDTGDGAAGAEGRQIRVEIEDDVGDAGTDAADEIEQEIREVAEVVFHVIAKNPEEEHVPGDMNESAMEEHASENGKKGEFEVVVAVEGGADMRRDRGVGHDEGIALVRAQGDLVKKDDDVRQNEKSVDDRVGAPRVQVFDGDEHAMESSARLGESGSVAPSFALKSFNFV